jgi:hypothetical protein
VLLLGVEMPEERLVAAVLEEYAGWQVKDSEDCAALLLHVDAWRRLAGLCCCCDWRCLERGLVAALLHKWEWRCLRSGWWLLCWKNTQAGR